MKNNRKLIIIVSTLFVCLICGALMYGVLNAEPKQPSDFEIATTTPSAEDTPTVSPDGHADLANAALPETIAYSGNTATPGNIVNNEPISINISGSIAYASNETLAASSTLIVKGIVANVAAAEWNTYDGMEPISFVQMKDMLYIDNKIQVTEVIKGEFSGEEVVVRTYGGEYPLGEKIIRISTQGAYGEFTPGEEVLLFLVRDTSSFNNNYEKNIGKVSDHYVLKGMCQGKFTITGDVAENVHGAYNISEFMANVEKNMHNEVQPFPPSQE